MKMVAQSASSSTTYKLETRPLTVENTNSDNDDYKVAESDVKSNVMFFFHEVVFSHFLQQYSDMTVNTNRRNSASIRVIYHCEW